VEPTRSDAFGIVFLEAWACGKPVIAADFGAVSEIVHDNVNGLLVRYGDWQGIEKALISLIDDRKFRTRLGESGKQDVIKKYSIENMVQNTELIYDSII
jgi:glycosyltransferase involved in cell wall biosynthesis